ncbi:hypothetical protein [Streptomyces harbinensis]|uniref:hypothetical protein n=1 Tax=Streptomyces harbinensis TaxID=1176198 RepID=UPI0036B8973B
MKRTIVSAAAAAIVLTGCSSNGSDGADAADGPEPSETPSSQPKTTTEEPPVEDALSLVEEWQPKLITLRDAGTAGVCDDATSVECGVRVLAILEAALELGEAIVDAGETDYPETAAEVSDVAAAGEGYVMAECMGNPAAPDSCASDVYSVILGPQAMHNALEMDHLNALG